MEIPYLNKQDLRKFGLMTGAIVAGLFGILLPWLFGAHFPLWPLIIAAVLWGLAMIMPSSLQPVYRLWMRFGAVLNWINTRLILGLVFYLIVLPTGIVTRLSGKDPMARRLHENIPTYRTPSRNVSRKSMEKPF